MTANDPHEDVEAAKHAARARARAARCALDESTCAAATREITRRLLALPELARARTVLAYAATSEELDPALAVDALRARGVSIALPRVESPGVLGLHVVGDGAALVAGMFGILEPTAEAPRVVAEQVDAVIVPGVAFDENRWRLGYGGGYYDRLLPSLRDDCVRIGIAYDEQVLATIPAEEHDVRVDLIVTPTRVIAGDGSGL